MKKSLAVILASAMAVSLTACGGSGNAKTPEPTTAAEAPKTEAQAEGTEAENGQEALDVFAQSPPDFFDLILMDIQMPVLDGYEATRRIRAMERNDARTVPIIAMTANAFREDIEKALSAGMDDVATKPLDIKLLIEKIEQVRSGEGPT